jgi:hypothetical protein
VEGDLTGYVIGYEVTYRVTGYALKRLIPNTQGGIKGAFRGG